MLLVTDRLDAAGSLARAVVAARHRSGLPVVFAGRVVAGDLRISCLRGNRSEALRGLSLPPDIGLGGRAVAMRRPVSVRDYATALAITHEHDTAVAREGLRALVAVPVVASDGQVAAVVYGGVRAAVSLGDRVVEDLVAAGRVLANDLDSGAGRNPCEEAPGRGRAELRDALVQMAADLANMPHRHLRHEVLDTCRGLLAVLDGRSEPVRRPAVSARELEVLALAAAGCGDAEIAERLGVTVGAVRSTVRSLRRAFGVRTRHAAVSAARAVGVLA